MATMHPILGSAFAALILHSHAQGLDNAEVRIPYGELKKLLARAEPAARPEVPKPALLSARLRISIEDKQPVINASFRTACFGDGVVFIPLIAGDVSLESQPPEDAVVVADRNTLCLAGDKNGIRTLQLRLLPVPGEKEFSITIPPCPSVIIETGELPANQSVVLNSGTREETLAKGRILPLPNTGHKLGIRLLDEQETREALRPPEPSSWTWQHQALVTPSDGGLFYQIIARASATDGSGVEALLPLPSDARDITVSGEDLVSHAKIRGGNREPGISLVWKTRGLLDRQVMICYRMPLRPLDQMWRLQVPGGEDTRCRFIIASSPLLAYSAEGLSAALSPQGLPAPLAESLEGMSCHYLESGPSAVLAATPIPVAATDEGVVKQAEWAVRIEPDGSMLATGSLMIEHKGPLGFVFDTPEEMKLLSCELGGRPVPPVDLGGGVFKIPLPPQDGNARLVCSFTRAGAALDPVEGTMKLSLPRTPLFVHSLLWHIDLPPGYQAETHGNLTRAPAEGSPPARISLRKNLCRGERPEVHVFYQRSDLNRCPPLTTTLMKFTHLIASLAIIGCTALAWFLLGAALTKRTEDSTFTLRNEVSGVWGPAITQQHPHAWFETPNAPGGSARVLPSASQVKVRLDSEPKRRGLVWHRTYDVRLDGSYTFTNPTKIPQTFYISFPLPPETSGLHGFDLRLDGDDQSAQAAPGPSGVVTRAIQLPAAGAVTLRAVYGTRGTGTWKYDFPDKRRISGFQLAMRTNFHEISFPVGTGSADKRKADSNGYDLVWNYPDVLDAQSIGMDMPKRLNAGPVAARIAFFAPVSLLFFVTVVLMIGGMRGIALHPMHVFFISAGFFAFHLLFAYLVDLLPLMQSFLIAAATSLLLVSGYLRAVAGRRLFGIALPAQCIYLVAFSASFFIDGLTGITLTVLAVATLALLMFLTAKTDWMRFFSRNPPPLPKAEGGAA